MGLSTERQLPFPSESHHVPRRKRKPLKRLTKDQLPLETNRWWTQKMFEPFTKGAQVWQHARGAEIASKSGMSVEDISADIDESDSNNNIKDAIIAAQRAKLPASVIIDKLYEQTRYMALRVNDSSGWTAAYFGDVVDQVIEIYPRDQKYGEDLKRKAFLVA